MKRVNGSVVSSPGGGGAYLQAPPRARRVLISVHPPLGATFPVGGPVRSNPVVMFLAARDGVTVADILGDLDMSASPSAGVEGCELPEGTKWILILDGGAANSAAIIRARALWWVE